MRPERTRDVCGIAVLLALLLLPLPNLMDGSGMAAADSGDRFRLGFGDSLGRLLPPLAFRAVVGALGLLLLLFLLMPCSAISRSNCTLKLVPLPPMAAEGGALAA